MTNFDKALKIDPIVFKNSFMEYYKKINRNNSISKNRLKVIFSKESDWFRLPGLNKEAMTIMGVRYEIRDQVKAFRLVLA